MRKTNSSIPALVIAFLCIAVYATALIIGAYRFYTHITERQVIAEREFYDLADIASAAGVLGFMDAPFQETIQDSLARSYTLEGAIISGPSGEYAFERERGAIIRWEGDSPRFVKRFGVSSTSVVPLRINGLRNVNISAGFRSVDYEYGVTILKHSLLVILAALAAAFLTFLVESALARDFAPEENPAAGRRKKDSRPSQYDDDEEIVDESGLELNEDEEDEEEPPARHRKRPEKADSHRSEAPETWARESLDFDGEPEPDFTGAEDSSGDFDTQEADSPGAPVPDPRALEEPEIPGAGDEDAKVPKGLYAPGSNIGWEEYTRDRLDSELHRCASFEQVLTVLLTAFSGKTELTSQQYKQFADMAVSFFNLRDLIFEKGGRGITVILPNTDLDQGFTKAEGFLNYLMTVFSDTSGFRIGVSARAGRLVDAQRLYFEAEEALNKALRDPASPIIAFKSDPEKYRAFLRSRGT
jgi:hypothetical protein